MASVAVGVFVVGNMVEVVGGIPEVVTVTGKII